MGNIDMYIDAREGYRRKKRGLEAAATPGTETSSMLRHLGDGSSLEKTRVPKSKPAAMRVKLGEEVRVHTVSSGQNFVIFEPSTNIRHSMSPRTFIREFGKGMDPWDIEVLEEMVRNF